MTTICHGQISRCIYRRESERRYLTSEVLLRAGALWSPAAGVCSIVRGSAFSTLFCLASTFRATPHCRNHSTFVARVPCCFHRKSALSFATGGYDRFSALEFSPQREGRGCQCRITRCFRKGPIESLRKTLYSVFVWCPQTFLFWKNRERAEKRSRLCANSTIFTVYRYMALRPR